MGVSIWRLAQVHGAIKYDQELLRRELCIRICLPHTLPGVAVDTYFSRSHSVHILICQLYPNRRLHPSVGHTLQQSLRPFRHILGRLLRRKLETKVEIHSIHMVLRR